MLKSKGIFYSIGVILFYFLAWIVSKNSSFNTQVLVDGILYVRIFFRQIFPFWGNFLVFLYSVYKWGLPEVRENRIRPEENKAFFYGKYWDKNKFVDEKILSFSVKKKLQNNKFL